MGYFDEIGISSYFQSFVGYLVCPSSLISTFYLIHISVVAVIYISTIDDVIV